MMRRANTEKMMEPTGTDALIMSAMMVRSWEKKPSVQARWNPRQAQSVVVRDSGR